ncbi:MAG TPA: Fic family protein [Thermoanaerobaculia bacterium]|nr:Fic family protein [Thermoanaerobaculia bacterium]
MAESEQPPPAAPRDLRDLSSVDAHYRGFPDFSSWARLGAVERDLWQRFAGDLAERRQASANEDVERAVNVAMRAAAIDTGAIEGLYTVDRGFTMSVALQSFAWQHEMAQHGAGVRELFEAQLAGYQLALDAATQKMAVSEAWLRMLHESICAPQTTYRVITPIGWQEQPFPKGRYKERPNHVRVADGSIHAYAPVADVGPEMHRLVEHLRSPLFEEAHPVEQASYAHFALTAIHPFTDGNGRVARALASIYFYRSVSVPLVIFANQKPEYWDLLARTDQGDQAPWLRFVANRGLDTMQLVEETLRTPGTTRPDEVRERLNTLFSPRGLSYAGLENVALRLLREAQTRWELRLAKSPNGPVSTTVLKGEHHREAPHGYRRIGGQPSPAVIVVLTTPPPAANTAECSFGVFIATNDLNPFGFRLEAFGSDDPLEIRDSDVTPELTGLLTLRLDQWIERHLGRMLAGLEKESRNALESRR